MKTQKARILAVDDDPDVLQAAQVVLKNHFSEVEALNDPGRLPQLLEKQSYDVVLLDLNYGAGETNGKTGLHWLRLIRELSPATCVVAITAYADVKLAVKAMKEGATDFVVKPWKNEKLAATLLSAFQLSRSRQEAEQLKTRQLSLNKMTDPPYIEMIGRSKAIESVFAAIEKIAGTDANVLIMGENGTGKELVARAIHRKSNRAEGLFVSVDVGAIPESLFESEMFGHKKGSFTDAIEDRTGWFQTAHGGTLFLDEIANISLSQQGKLLSAIQTRMVNRVGDNKSVAVDTRLITATNIQLQEMIAAKKFRPDLLYRINTIEITLPPLRERKEDIPLLIDHFLALYGKKYRKPGFSLKPDTYKKLMHYNWPGNIRELQHAVERAVILSAGSYLEMDDFIAQTQKEEPSSRFSTLDEIEEKTIKEAIQRNFGNLKKTAEELGLGRTTLYRKIQKYGI